MSILEVLTYPDPFLKISANPVQNYDDSLKQLAANMVETMYTFNGIGLAATQIGAKKRIVVIDVKYKLNDLDSQQHPMVMINPEIVQLEGEMISEEGCLSVPEFRAEVKRFEKIALTYTDLEGTVHQLQTDGLESICIQHELDHLDGKLFIDYLSPLKRKMIQTKLKKRSKN